MSILRHDCAPVLTQAVEGGGLVFTSGVLPNDPKADIKGQASQVLEEIDRLLSLAGSSRDRILLATIWVADIRLREPFNEVWTEWVKEPAVPARACVEAKLADPNAMVEVAVVALKNPKREEG